MPDALVERDGHVVTVTMNRADLRAMAGDVDVADPLDHRARMAEDPDIIYKALFRHFRPTKPSPTLTGT